MSPSSATSLTLNTSSTMMTFLQLTLLTLLAVSPSLLISAETVITCDNNVQSISCDSGVINIESAFYGRTSSTICSENRPPAQLANTECIAPITTIAERCNGLRECVFKANKAGISDPCPGTAKYFSTTYSCIPGQISTICVNSYKTLSCGSFTIKIINAVYGRTTGSECKTCASDPEDQKNDCYANAYSDVATMCDGQTACNVFSSKANFPGHCHEAAKYLTVSYTCNVPKEVVVCEGSNATLSCGTLSIKVLSANYGRTDSTTCTDGRPTSQISKTNCYQTDSLVRVGNSCNGQNTCVVPATNTFFTDPCSGTYKYLYILYSCE